MLLQLFEPSYYDPSFYKLNSYVIPDRSFGLQDAETLYELFGASVGLLPTGPYDLEKKLAKWEEEFPAKEFDATCIRKLDTFDAVWTRYYDIDNPAVWWQYVAAICILTQRKPSFVNTLLSLTQ